MRRALLPLLLLLALPASAEPLVAGHDVRMLTSGQRAFLERHRNIADADVVLLKTYALHDDETGRGLIEALRQRALAGKQVFVQYDVKGSSRGAGSLLARALGLTRGVPAYLRPLAEAGAILIPTHAPTLVSPLFGRDHDKLLVTWKKGAPARVIMGGMNVGNAYAYGGNWGAAGKPSLGFRDTDVELTGPEAARVVDRFVEAAERARPGASALGKLRHAVGEVTRAPEAFARSTRSDAARVRFVANDPKDGRRSIEHLYERLIAETPRGETVTIANAYTLLGKSARNAVVAATQRGVKFHFIVNSPHAQEREASFLGLAVRDQLRTLLRETPAGSLEITEFAGDPRRNEGAMHQKIAKFGSRGPVVVGSHNLDAISANHNSEAVAVIEGHRVSQQFDALIGRMKREGVVRRLDAKALRRDSVWSKVKSFALHRVAAHAL